MSTDVQLNLTSTTSLLLDSGVAIEQLRGGQILLWQDGQLQVGSEVTYAERRYVPAPLTASLEAQLSFPATTEAYDDVEVLADNIQQKFLRFVPTLEKSSLEVLADAVLASWVVDCLPAPPVIVLEASEADCESLVRVLEATVRRPLTLSNPSLRELAKLEPSLSPTIILVQPLARTVQQLLAVFTRPEGTLLQDGACQRLRSAVFVITSTPLELNAVTIPVPETETYSRLGVEEVRQIQDELQPKLLRYRLERHAEVASSCFDLPELASPVRMLARNLGCALEGSPGSQLALSSAIGQLDEQIKVRKSMGDRALLLEALLVLCHEDKAEAVVGELAELATDIRTARGDGRKMEPKTAGAILRSLGFSPARKNGGYTLTLDLECKERIHKLASREGALMLADPKPDCEHCQPFLPEPEIPIEI